MGWSTIEPYISSISQYFMSLQSFGVIGLAVMGENLALNVESRGFPIAVYNRSRNKTDNFMATRAQGKQVKAAYTIEEFVGLLQRPRNILIMVQSDAVKKVIEELKPFLDKDDVIIDGGNSLYTETDERTKELAGTGFTFIGMGISGGEEGALNGPSMMPGGTEAAYKNVEPILNAIAAKVDGEPCVTYIGKGSAGHYVKMVHNGIEYGDMQLIAEAYDLLKNVAGLNHEQLHQVFTEWNQTDELNSFLIEITADIFKYIDPETSKPLVEMILDAAGQKGTGRWTVQGALEIGIAIPTMFAAVNARIMSSIKTERVSASKVLTGPEGKFTGDVATFVNQVRDALYCSKICSYAQGMALLSAASHTRDYNLNLSKIAKIWRGGCIIRAGFLNKIAHAFEEDPKLANLLLAPEFKQTILDRQGAWRQVISQAALMGIPVPAFSSSLDYFDSYRRDVLPQNLTQAQRDYFGAHTYLRVDKPPTKTDEQGKTVPNAFHTEWTK